MEKETTDQNADSRMSNVESNSIMLVCLQCENILPKISLSHQNFITMILIECQKCKSKNSTTIENYYNELKKKESLKIKPNCTKKPEHSDNKAVNFCIKCDAWVCSLCLIDHSLYETKHEFHNSKIYPEYYCNLDGHKKRNKTIYCKQCNIMICTKCKKKNHYYHSSESYDKNSSYAEFEDYLAKIKTQKQMNKQLKESYVKQAEQQIAIWTQTKNNIINSFITNSMNNVNIEMLLKDGLENFKKYPNIQSYSLMKTIKNNCIIKNINGNVICNDSLLNQCNQLINYFNNDLKNKSPSLRNVLLLILLLILFLVICFLSIMMGK